MTKKAKPTFGAVLKVGPAGGAVTALAELTSITPPSRSRGTIDVTTHDGLSQAMEYIAEGVYDEGEISLTGFWLAGSADEDVLSGASATGDRLDVELTVKAEAGTETLSAEVLVTAYEASDLPITGVQEYSATLKVSGPVTQAPTV